MVELTIRAALPEDAGAAVAVLRTAFGGEAELFPEPARLSAPDFARALQTGHRVLLAEAGDRVAGVVRTWDDDGIGWFDWLAAGAAGAGRALVRAAETGAQDRGIRLLRTKAPEDGVVRDYFERRGYRPVGREETAGGALVTLERRLPLLTVREQRRADADAIAAIAGVDPWPLAQENRRGWFVLSDGDRVVGATWVKDADGGLATIAEPALLPGYRGRGIELWMVERAAIYAGTEGFHTAEVAASPVLDAMRRELEDRRWFPEGAVYRKVLGERPLPSDGHEEW